jgi:hypothetical protein
MKHSHVPSPPAADPLALLRNENDRLRTNLLALEEQRDGARQALGKALLALDERDQEQAALAKELGELQAANQTLEARCLEVEQQNTHLVYLQVAVAQLYATSDRDTALAAIRDIVINLIGSEELAIWGFDERGGALPLLDSFGLDRDAWSRVPLERGVIGCAAITGERFVAGRSPAMPVMPANGETNLTACIPLKLGQRVIGAIGIFGLLPQKGGLGPLDFELFELLASQGAEALVRHLGGET